MAQSRQGERARDVAPPAIDWQGDDAELLRRAREGCRTAAVLLHDRYCTDVNRLVRRVMGPDPDHDDLVNDIFLALVKNVHRVREADKLRSWMMSVALNILRGELRKRTMRRRFFSHDAEAEPTFEPDPQGRALVARTFAVIERLPPDQRIAFTLRYMDQQTLGEIAEVCACSLATIKRRLARASRRFVKLAGNNPALHARLQRGRWGLGQTPAEDDEG